MTDKRKCAANETSHSNQRDEPEMYTVTYPEGNTDTACGKHAKRAEDRGAKVRLQRD